MVIFHSYVSLPEGTVPSMCCRTSFFDIQLAKSGARTESNENKQGTSAFFSCQKEGTCLNVITTWVNFFSNTLSHLSQKTKAPREHLKNSTSDGIFTMDFLWIVPDFPHTFW